MSIVQFILFIILFFVFRFCLNLYFKIRAFKKMVSMGQGQVFARTRGHSHGHYPPEDYPRTKSSQEDIEVSYRVLKDK